MTTQIIGVTTANTAEVEAATKAMRITPRPEDYGALGIYSVAGVSGIMAAGITQSSVIWSFRWGSGTATALIKRIVFSAAVDTVAFTIGIAWWNLHFVQSFTASDSGGTSLLPSGNMNKLRTLGMGTSLLTDARISSTAALTAGTRYVSQDALSGLMCGVPATAGVLLTPPKTLVDSRPGEFPIVLQQNEGLVLKTTVPLTGTWKFAVKVDWTEIAPYP